MQDAETRLREAVRDLLAGEKVGLVIGHEKGSVPLRSRPCFVRSVDAADRLVWNGCCTNNLAVYLPRLFERPPQAKGPHTPPTVGIVAKGCDARSVVGLLKEHQIRRENLVVIGMPCPGMVDPERVEAALGMKLQVGAGAPDYAADPVVLNDESQVENVLALEPI